MEYLILLAGCFLVGILTLVTGFGLGTLLPPFFTFFYNVKLALLLVAIVHLANNLFKFFLFRRHLNVSIFRHFGLVSLVGALFGAALFGMARETGEEVEDPRVLDLVVERREQRFAHAVLAHLLRPLHGHARDRRGRPLHDLEADVHGPEAHGARRGLRQHLDEITEHLIASAVHDDLSEAEEVLPVRWGMRPHGRRVAEAIGWTARRWL